MVLINLVLQNIKQWENLKNGLQGQTSDLFAVKQKH